MNRRGRTDHDPITIRGLIIPCDWDEKGNVIAIAISTFDENEYFIDKDKQSENLLLLIGEEVEISGVFRKKSGKKRIKMKKYRLLKGREEFPIP